MSVSKVSNTKVKVEEKLPDNKDLSPQRAKTCAVAGAFFLTLVSAPVISIVPFVAPVAAYIGGEAGYHLCKESLKKEEK